MAAYELCGDAAALPLPVAVFPLLLMTNREKTKQFLLVSPTLQWVSYFPNLIRVCNTTVVVESSPNHPGGREELERYDVQPTVNTAPGAFPRSLLMPFQTLMPYLHLKG